MAGVEFKFTPSPDWRRLDKALRRKGEPDRVPFFELFADAAIMEAVVGRRFPAGPAPEARRERARIRVDFHLKAGYDYVGDWTAFNFPRRDDPKSEELGRRFMNSEVSTIANRADFESYPWPEVRDEHFAPIEALIEILPEGMRIKTSGLNVLESVMRLTGYEGLAMILADEEDLVGELFDRVGPITLDFFTRLAQFEEVHFIDPCEDMGFKTQTMFSPEFLRRHVFPWHGRIVKALHARGKVVTLHACGFLDEVIEDILAAGYDARHSFEDAITPVAEAKRRWGGRIAHCGGFDVDKLCRLSVGEIRAHTRNLIAECAPGGGWCLGTGNSVASYIPLANYVAMLEEGRAVGSYPVE